eukprot:gene14977-17703_t
MVDGEAGGSGSADDEDEYRPAFTPRTQPVPTPKRNPLVDDEASGDDNDDNEEEEDADD